MTFNIARRSGAGVFLLLFAPAIISAEPDQQFEVRLGVDEAGAATAVWKSILQKRLAPAEYRALADVRKPFTHKESEWIEMIRSRVPEWSAALPALAAPYESASPPPRIVIVLGNRGASDAFTHDAMTIGFDLAALQSEYGEASANLERIDRFFRHEYTHLMQKSWLRMNPYPADSPMRAALLDIWLEGLGNYYSLSSRWRAKDGVPSEKAKAILTALEPRFCARLSALACSSPDHARRLTSDLSEGPFEKKWGALTLALWLEEEMSVSPDAYRRLVEAGPNGVSAIASRHLSADLSTVLAEALAAAELCRR